jgi:peptidoglycan/xylan/chitin deacetylase (PgdA/CDA1 family)
LGWRPFAVFCYHEVADRPAKWAVTPAAFAAHLGWLRELGCNPVSMAQVLAQFRGAGNLPPKAVCLHFDDARSGFWDSALAPLRGFGFPAALYVVPGWVDRRSPVPESERYGEIMTWEQIRAAAADRLVEIGCHGDTHRNLKRVPRRRLEQEIAGARRALEDRLGEAVVHFAPPYNRVNGRIRRAVRDAGYQSLSGGGGSVNGRFLASPFRIRRILVSARFDRDAFARVVGRLGAGEGHLKRGSGCRGR